MNFERIYLDHAATTPVRAEVTDVMLEASARAQYNPGSLHAEGRHAAAVLDDARDRAAAVLRAHRNEILFTAGGTEADNLAIIGTAHAAKPRSRLVASAVEHHAVLASFERLECEGYETALVPVDSGGRLDVDIFDEMLAPATALVSVMYANNETGTIQPVAALARRAHERGVLFHTDAVQAPGWLPMDVTQLGVDLLTLSAHKFGGPKGAGLLYVRHGIALQPLLRGGGQEFGRRAGTPNVPGIVGMVRALELAAEQRERAVARVGVLRDRLEAGVRSRVEDVRINGAESSRLPNFLNVSFAGIDSLDLLIALDLAGVAVSAGSACTSGSLKPSHVLAAMGLEPRWQRGAIRFSLGRETTAQEIDRMLALLPGLIADLRRPAAAAQRDG